MYFELSILQKFVKILMINLNLFTISINIDNYQFSQKNSKLLSDFLTTASY